MYARIRRYQTRASTPKKSFPEASQEALLVTYYAQLTPEMRQKLIDIARMLSELAVKQVR